MRAVLLLALVQSALGYDNGMGKIPPMGWQTWCSVGPCGTDHCFDGQIRAMADTLVESGMKDLGYNWVILDDCWHPSRDENDTLVPFPRFFPDGMKPVIDYVHSLGLQFGLYTSVGDKTCHGGWSPGSYQHYEKDAQTFADWEVDYVKIDYCGSHDSPEGHKNMSDAMNATGRHMSYMLCRGPYQKEDHYGYAPDIAQGWRATGDHHDNFASTMQQVNSVKGKSTWSKPYGWAYLDMMMIGGEGCKDQGDGGDDDTHHWNWTEPKHCPGQTDNEYRTEMSLYTVVSSPLMIGTDIRLMTPIMKELLLNTEAIAINQDYQAVPGDAQPACKGPVPETCSVSLEKQISNEKCVAGKNFGCNDGTSKMWIEDGCRGEFTCNGNSGIVCDVKGGQHVECECAADGGEVWVRRLTDGDLAIAMPNLDSKPANLSICFDALDYGETAHVRDIWKKKDLGVFTQKFTAEVDTHDTLLLRVSAEKALLV
jgi:alpha-galactosidase